MGELGLNPIEFWKLTPVELFTMADGYVKKQKRHNNDLIYAAWNTANFSRMKQMPSLKSLMQDTESKHREQTDEEMFAMAKMLNAAFGGEVVEA